MILSLSSLSAKTDLLMVGLQNYLLNQTAEQRMSSNFFLKTFTKLFSWNKKGIEGISLLFESYSVNTVQ